MLAVNRSYGGSEFDKVCRLCSSNNGIIVLNIFHGEGKKRRILSLINACLPVKISEYDPLPKVICHHCLHKLEVFREFQENCLKSEETLRNGGPSCSVTYPTFSNSSQDYVQNEPEETAPHFAAEIHPLPPDPLFHQQPVPAEQNAEEEIIDIRRDHFLPPRSELEVIVVKQEPQDRSPAPEEDIRWQDSTAEDENGMQMEHSELDSLPPEEEVKSEGFTSAEPVISAMKKARLSRDKYFGYKNKKVPGETFRESCGAMKKARLSQDKSVSFKSKNIPAKTFGESCGVERDFIVTKTNRGKRCLLRGRYKYRKARETRGGFIIWRVEKDFVVTKTNKGNHGLLLGQYKYRMAQVAKSGFIKWRCTNRKCNAVLKTDPGCTTLVYKRNVHTHKEISWQKLHRNVQ